MAETDIHAPPSASAETDELVRQLQTLYARHQAIREELRRGPGHSERDAVLVELCGFRGMQYTEAAQLIGYTREGVARRVRPLLDDLGVADLSPIRRQLAEVDRPLRAQTIEELKAALKPPKGEAARTRREAGREARALTVDMRKLLDRLHRPPHSLSYVSLAGRLGVSVPTLQRVRGVMK